VLVELVVENYAVVERARLRLRPGFNVLTGETGSGKSIVVGALALLLGARASSDAVRAGAERARVSGIFEAPASAAALLGEAGIEPEDGELLIEREVLASGKSRAFVSGKPVTAAFLRDLAVYLGDIHGQHDQQALFEPAAQLALLDEFAGLTQQVGEAARRYAAWRSASEALEELERNAQENLRLADLWNFQRKEIEAAQLRPGEDQELENERRVLQNVNRLLEAASTAYQILYEAEGSAYAQVRTAMRRLEELARIDHEAATLAETLQPAQVAIEEVSATLRSYLSRLEADPQRLDKVESRLALIERLKRKYAPTVEGILEFLEDARRRIEQVENLDEQRARLLAARDAEAGEYQKLASYLSAERHKAAAVLATSIEHELKALAMAGTRVVFSLEAAEWSPTGMDRLAILVAPNVGEEPKPLARIASGGELSRIALAIKTCLAGGSEGASGRTLVFDEVDAGIGGAAAEAVGRRLRKLARRDQVLCVTHLAQIAGFADHHYAVSKREAGGRTIAEIEELTGEARTREIGRMIAGQRLTPEALRHAEQLIRASAAASD
jgi:DNA repair protein RecN (Recombination protein N)